MTNYFDEVDSRVRQNPYTIDSQLLNIAALELEKSAVKVSREVQGRFLTSCPANLDNTGLYWQVPLPLDFDYTTTHSVRGVIGSFSFNLSQYDDFLPTPSVVALDPNVAIVPLVSSELFSFSGVGNVQYQAWAAQRMTAFTLPIPSKLRLFVDGITTNNISIQVKITGYKNPTPVWQEDKVLSSETVSIKSLGLSLSKFSWSYVDSIVILGLPADVTLTGYCLDFELPYQKDSLRPFTHPDYRDVTFDRYWTADSFYLNELYLQSNMQGYQRAQTYFSPSTNALVVEPNTFGMFIANGTSLSYLDRREPMPANLSSTALTVEPYYGVTVTYSDFSEGIVTYVDINPVAYSGASEVSQYRYLITLPDSSNYVLTPDGTFSPVNSNAGWRYGVPADVTIPLAQLGTYVITLQCLGESGQILSDSYPYGNFAPSVLNTLDVSTICSNIQGMSFDDRNRLWIWDGSTAYCLKFNYYNYVVDQDTASIYFTYPFDSIAIDE